MHTVLDESVLHRRIGDNAIMGAQLDRLLELSEYDNIDLRILPLAAPHYILTGGFNLLEFDRAHDVGYNDIVYLEHLIGSVVPRSGKRHLQISHCFSAAVRFFA